jgi:predicted enzyme related to lactoylglutathione lyase
MRLLTVFTVARGKVLGDSAIRTFLTWRIPMPGRQKTRRTAAPIPVRGIDFVMCCASDVGKTRSWYQALFGLTKGEESTKFWSEFATEPVSLCLNGPNRTQDNQWTWKGPAAIALAVDNIHTAARVCRRRRIRILRGPVETRVCWMLFIADPDGNRLVLHQRKDGTAG